APLRWLASLRSLACTHTWLASLRALACTHTWLASLRALGCTHTWLASLRALGCTHTRPTRWRSFADVHGCVSLPVLRATAQFGAAALPADHRAADTSAQGMNGNGSG